MYKILWQLIPNLQVQRKTYFYLIMLESIFQVFFPIYMMLKI